MQPRRREGTKIKEKEFLLRVFESSWQIIVTNRRASPLK
jgi:hypothetical protein